ncbi:MAG TPA: SIS domain-containing protein [Chlamydiales bacterium]|nr:SIS domain-containing protein [Chlamydiales bacterium]
MFSKRFEELSSTIDSCSYSNGAGPLSEDQALDRFFAMVSETKGIVYVIGNGGSAGIASHFSNDLMKALKIRSQTLYDSNIMTCLSNDIGYENVFSYPLDLLLKPEDLLVAISSSGKSPNILKAVDVARRRGVPVITLSGFLRDNPLNSAGQLNFWIDRCDYGLVEVAHFFLLHTVIDLWHKKSFTGCKTCSNH